MKKICEICHVEFETNHPRTKYCSDDCRTMGWLLYMRERSKEKYKNDPEFRKKSINSSKKWRERNKEKVNAYARKYQKKWRMKRRDDALKSLSKEGLKFLKNLAKEQQTFTYVRKSKCEVPNCDSPTDNLILHEITYSPIKTVTLCARHHSILHLCILRGKKVKKRINN